MKAKARPLRMYTSHANRDGHLDQRRVSPELFRDSPDEQSKPERQVHDDAVQ